MKYLKKHSKPAFTLAEVLVTLAIIGVVASLTIPGIVKNHQKQTWMSNYKESINIVNQATKMIMADNNGVMPDVSTNDLTAYNAYKSYFKTIKSCENIDAKGSCLGSSYKCLDGSSCDAIFYSPAYSIITTKGTSIYFMSDPANKQIHFWIDINGPKGSNIVGKDMNTMYVDQFGVVKPRGGNRTEAQIASNCPASLTGETCIGSYCGVRILRGDYGEDY